MAQKPGTPKETAAPAQWLHVRELKPWGRNPRRNAQAVEPLARAIRAHGFGAPLVAQAGTLRIVAGHTRRLAVQHLLRDAPGWEIPGSPGPGYVPVRVLEVSDEDATALALADNNRALQGEWDDEALLAVLGDARQSGTNALAAAGWADAVIDGMLESAARAAAGKGDPDGKEYDEDVAGDVKTVECPHCGKLVPLP